jgi:hypothetical protein
VATKHDLEPWVLDAVREAGGSCRPIDVAKHVWQHHEDDLRGSGDLFYTWQYDLRWAAQKLRNAGKLRPKNGQRTGTWDLA